MFIQDSRLFPRFKKPKYIPGFSRVSSSIAEYRPTHFSCQSGQARLFTEMHVLLRSYILSSTIINRGHLHASKLNKFLLIVSHQCHANMNGNACMIGSSGQCMWGRLLIDTPEQTDVNSYYTSLSIVSQSKVTPKFYNKYF